MTVSHKKGTLGQMLTNFNGYATGWANDQAWDYNFGCRAIKHNIDDIHIYFFYSE